MKTINSVYTIDCYIYLPTRSALCKYEPTKVWFNLETGDVRFCAKVGGEECNLSGDFKFYRNEAEFKAGKEWNPKRSAAEKAFNFCLDENDKVFVFKNGQAVEMLADDVLPEVLVWEKGKGYSYDGAKAYYSAQDCYDHNEYDVIDENGNKVHHVGKYVRMAFSPEQEALLAEFDELTDRMMNVGIRMVMDDSDSLHAFNYGAVESIDCDVYDDYVDGWEFCKKIKRNIVYSKFYDTLGFKISE